MAMKKFFQGYLRSISACQGDKSVAEFYGELKSLIDELEMHQPALTDAANLKGHRQELAVPKFMSGLSPTL